MKTAESFEAVHTHTHTHTHVYVYRTCALICCIHNAMEKSLMWQSNV